jgi:hypothetical protein
MVYPDNGFSKKPEYAATVNKNDFNNKDESMRAKQYLRLITT